MRPLPGSTVGTVRDFWPSHINFGPLTTKLPLSARRPLGRAIGWHLMITAVR